MSHHIPSARRGGQALGVVLVWTCSSDAAEPTQAVIPLVYVCVAQRDGVERALRRAVYPGAYLSYLTYLPTCLPATNPRCAQNHLHGAATSCSTLRCPVLGYCRIQGATSHSSAQPLHASQAFTFAKLVFARICSVCVCGMVLAKKGAVRSWG
jgi:hypothetical protein